VGRLHCLLPWWNDATVDFMTSGGYNVAPLIGKVCEAFQVVDECCIYYFCVIWTIEVV